MVGTTKTSSGRTAKHTAAAASKRCKEGYQRHNGRWEARYRPQSRHELKQDNVTIAAFKGFKKGLYKYEFLEYFDSAEEKDEWLSVMKKDFTRRKNESDPNNPQNKILENTTSGVSTAGDSTAAAAAAYISSTPRFSKMEISNTDSLKRSRSVPEPVRSSCSSSSDEEYIPSDDDIDLHVEKKVHVSSDVEGNDSNTCGKEMKFFPPIGIDELPIGSPPKHNCADVASARLMWYCSICQCYKGPGHAQGLEGYSCSPMKAILENSRQPALMHGALRRPFTIGPALSPKVFSEPTGPTSNLFEPTAEKEEELLDGLVKYMMQSSTDNSSEEQAIEKIDVKSDSVGSMEQIQPL